MKWCSMKRYRCKCCCCGCSWQWASYQIRKIAGCACAGNAGNVSPRRRFQTKPLVSDPGMHHGTCVPHVPWCMSESLTCGGRENVTGIPGACAPAISRIWQEAHGDDIDYYYHYHEIWIWPLLLFLLAPCTNTAYSRTLPKLYLWHIYSTWTY